MSKKLIATIVTVGISILGAGNVQAYSKPSQDGLHSISIQQDSALHETTALAEKIWDKLPAEFVEQYEEGRYARAAATARSAYELAASTFGPNHINTADSMLKLGIFILNHQLNLKFITA